MNIKKIAALILVLILAVSGAAADSFFFGVSEQTIQRACGDLPEEEEAPGTEPLAVRRTVK